jgi:hypothetical protein
VPGLTTEMSADLRGTYPVPAGQPGRPVLGPGSPVSGRADHEDRDQQPDEDWRWSLMGLLS